MSGGAYPTKLVFGGNAKLPAEHLFDDPSDFFGFSDQSRLTVGLAGGSRERGKDLGLQRDALDHGWWCWSRDTPSG